jgi:hypothetical protein
MEEILSCDFVPAGYRMESRKYKVQGKQGAKEQHTAGKIRTISWRRCSIIGGGRKCVAQYADSPITAKHEFVSHSPANKIYRLCVFPLVALLLSH